MDLQFKNGIGYFPYKQMQRQIELKGEKIYVTEKDILEATKEEDGYNVVGCVGEFLVKDLLGRENRTNIYVVSSRCGSPIFCDGGGWIIYY